ncbi:MAG TPA: hypothetical protein VFV31_05700 [Chitinophagaceae bacterium]|nr:hypothetical protein [Chitinophagaceae bacterium]
MKERFFLLLTALLISFASFTQLQQPSRSRLKVFVDCSSTWCDMTFIRTEINIVDFLLDNQAADVHILITSQGTGSGGDQYQLIFFGQNDFKKQLDTLRFNTDPNITEFEERDLLLKYLKLGLAPFIAKTEAVKNISLNFKVSGVDSTGKETKPQATKDPWNYWVFRVGANGNINADAVYKNYRYSGNMEANRTTDEWKIGFSTYGSKNKSIFEYDDGTGTQKLEVDNHDWGFSHFLVKSINGHWSWGYEANYNQNTFSNNKGRAFFRTAVEYDIFPYKEVNNKLFTISYGFTLRNNRYYDTTIYNKLRETLAGHRFDANLSFNQKWGQSYVGVSYHNYFHDWNFFNLGLNAYTNVRITGGLSFYVSVFGALTRDQVFLQKGNASAQEVLARQRQLASGYNYYLNFGINYRFGSKLNNFVNPRFESGNNMYF